MAGGSDMFDLQHGVAISEASPDHRAVVLDRQHLMAQAMGDEMLAAEVLEMFMEQSADILRTIRDAASVAIRSDAAHRLKGGARAIGAFRVADAAQALEDLAEEAHEDDVLEAIAALHAAVAEARATIAATLHGSDRPGL